MNNPNTPEQPDEHPHGPWPRTFRLERDHDVSGVSGTGIVAHGVLWPDGTASLRWTGERASAVHWDRFADAEAVHGHQGATRFVWADEQGGPGGHAVKAWQNAHQRATEAEKTIARVRKQLAALKLQGATGRAYNVALNDALDPPGQDADEPAAEQSAPADWRALSDAHARKWKAALEWAEQLKAERDGAYRERAQLLALLACHYPAVATKASDVTEPGWRLLYLTLPTGQASWHIAPRDVDLFAHVPAVDAEDPRAQWDGHTTDQKYERIAEHVRDLTAFCTCSFGDPRCANCRAGDQTTED